jgi:hypothetical protein
MNFGTPKNNERPHGFRDFGANFRALPTQQFCLAVKPGVSTMTEMGAGSGRAVQQQQQQQQQQQELSPDSSCVNSTIDAATTTGGRGRHSYDSTTTTTTTSDSIAATEAVPRTPAAATEAAPRTAAAVASTNAQRELFHNVPPGAVHLSLPAVREDSEHETPPNSDDEGPPGLVRTPYSQDALINAPSWL